MRLLNGGVVTNDLKEGKIKKKSFQKFLLLYRIKSASAVYKKFRKKCNFFNQSEPMFYSIYFYLSKFRFVYIKIFLQSISIRMSFICKKTLALAATINAFSSNIPTTLIPLISVIIFSQIVNNNCSVKHNQRHFSQFSSLFREL